MAGGLSIFVVTPQFGQFACGNWVLGILLVTMTLAFLQLRGIAEVRSKQAAYDEATKRARAKWKQLYYCSRDDIVFNPDEHTLMPIQSLQAYIYSQAS